MHGINTFADIAGAIIVIWIIPWKIYAVWLAARHNKKAWFVVLALINTASILEMIYIFKVEKKKWAEVKADFKHGWEILRRTKKDDFKAEKK